MKAHQTPIGKNDEWLTPEWILKDLGEFDLDPCDARQNPFVTARQSWYSKGLDREWSGRVWCNPPFNRYERPKWMRKMAEHDNGIMLIPAATETEAFQEWVWQCASGICFLNRRPHFLYVDGTQAKANSGCSICLVAYGEENLKILAKAHIGITIDLDKTLNKWKHQ